MKLKQEVKWNYFSKEKPTTKGNYLVGDGWNAVFLLYWSEAFENWLHPDDHEPYTAEVLFWMDYPLHPHRIP